MKELWMNEAKSLGWDEPIPMQNSNKWVNFFKEMFQMESISFKRCIKPANAVGNPVLVLFSDGSENAYGACAYVRWKIATGEYKSSLLAAKTRVTPIKKVTVVRSELMGAVLATRLGNTIERETRLKFIRRHFIVDSQIVRSMINRDSYGFNTFVAVRIGEIQSHTNGREWSWIAGTENVSDIITRGKSPSEIGEHSIWQTGPSFLKLPEHKWPTLQDNSSDLPEEVKQVMLNETVVVDDLYQRIDITRYSSYDRLMRVTARVLSMYQSKPKATLKNAFVEPDKEILKKAELFWIKNAQASIKQELERGKLKRLAPITTQSGIIIVGRRIMRYAASNYDEDQIVMIPANHRLALLYAMKIHKETHSGVSATVSKIRSRMWITGLPKLVKSLKKKCVICRLREKKTEQQVMGPLPFDRLKPAPAWSTTGLDFFGPFEIKGEVNQRSTGKAYGVIFACAASRAIHLEVADDYSTNGFLKTMRRFVSIRGYPSMVRSDPGSQLTAASKELIEVIRSLDQNEMQRFGAERGLSWKFSPADGPWQNGATEALVKTVKQALFLTMSSHRLTFSELLTVFYETANLVNERPIGKHPTEQDDFAYLSPNHLLLGRASNRAPSGPFKEPINYRQRFEFVQSIINDFWKRWIRDFFPSLIVEQKWHVEKRNVRVGDVVIVQDSNILRGEWKLALVRSVVPSDDGKVRRVHVSYKNDNGGRDYHGTNYVTIERPIQKLVVVVPVEETNE